MSADVLITGIGIVSPAGLGREATWSALLAGGMSVRRLVGGIKPEKQPFCAAPVHGFQPPAGTEHLSRTCQLAVAAAGEALDAAGLSGNPSRRQIRVSIGTSKPLVDVLNANACGRRQGASPAISPPCTLFDLLPDAPARSVSAHFGLGGFHASVSACATGAHAIIRGAGMIRHGDAEIVLAGSADSSLSPLWLSAYRQMGVLAWDHPERGPAWACRPFDRDRAGFVVGEGAAMLVLESRQSAARRGVRPQGHLAGWAAGSDPAGLTQLSPTESPLAAVIQTALADATTEPAAIRCIYAHGTGTLQNDRTEIRTFARVFERHLTSLPVVSLKGAIGHLMGAAGAIEIALAVLAIRDRTSPGTVTLIEPDPDFDAACLPRASFSLPGGPFLKTSLGFGGHLAALVIQGP
jgi:3-oxoacyl-[acyl-carrier-protein] synthase II